MIRKANLSDLAGVTRIWREYMEKCNTSLDAHIPSLSDLEYWVNVLGSDDHNVVVKVRRGRPVAFSHSFIIRRSIGKDSVYISEVYTRPKDPEKGLREKLIESQESWAKSNNINILELLLPNGIKASANFKPTATVYAKEV